LSVVGTPQSRVDLLHDLLDKDNGWAKAKYQAVKTDKGGNWVEPLWPGRYTLDELRKIQATMDSVSWSKEMMCNPVSGNASLYPWSLIEHNIIEGLGADGVVKPQASYFLGCDVSISDKGNHDFSVFTIGERIDGGPLKVVHVVREEGKSTEKQLAIIRDLDTKYNFNHVLVEQNGISYELANQVMKDSHLRTKAEGFTTTAKNKTRILGAVEIAFRNKGLFIPKNEILIEELLNFGIRQKEDGFGGVTQSYEGLGAHDDCVMSLALCLEACQGSGVRTTLEMV
jgi:phage terminase large subunit-like protein